jgi:phosphoribosylpyrophosphate synthetase
MDNIPIQFKVVRFSTGELKVFIINLDGVVERNYSPDSVFEIECIFSGSDDIIVVASLVDALKEAVPDGKIQATLPYIPASTQDKIGGFGQSFGARVYANLLTSIGVDFFVCSDVHSDTIRALFPIGSLSSIDRSDLFLHWYNENKSNFEIENILTIVVVPDSSAIHKTLECASAIEASTIVYGVKYLSSHSGKVEYSSVYCEHLLETAYMKYNVVVVDDICESGTNYIELMKIFEKRYPMLDIHKKILYTTHGVYSKGLDTLGEVYDVVGCSYLLGSVVNGNSGSYGHTEIFNVDLGGLNDE